MKSIKKLSVAIIMATISSGVFAATPLTTTSTFQSSAKLSASCQVSVNPLSFGAITPSVMPTQFNTTMLLTCSKGLVASIAIDSGVGGAGTGYRAMSGSAGNEDKLKYNIYYEPDINDDSQGWSVTNYYDVLADGTSQPIKIYGQVEGGQYIKPDNYNDTLLVMINY